MLKFYYRNDSPVMCKKKVLVDLDGVLNNYGINKFDESYIPSLKKGARSFIEQLAECGELYLFTSRNLLLASKWLIQNDIDQFFKDVTNIKLPSYIYIDDRTICFRGNYDQTLSDVKNFKPYWKNIP